MNPWEGLIKRYRRVNGLTQAALAELLGVEQATVSRWERGNHAPDLGTQRRLRDLLSRSSVANDCVIYHRVRCSLSPIKIADQNGRNHAASLPAAHLHGVQADKLQRLDYRTLFTDILEEQWHSAIKAGFFAGEIASIRVANPWRPAGKADLRYCECLWTPAILSDGHVLLVSEIHELNETAYVQAVSSGPMQIVPLDELL